MPPGRRELYNFPPDSLECTQPLLQRRKKLTKLDAQPVEGWRSEKQVKKVNKEFVERQGHLAIRSRMTKIMQIQILSNLHRHVFC